MKTIICILLLGAVALGGCLSRPNLVKETFAFSSPKASTAETNEGPVIGIRQISVAPQFDGQSFTYRTGELSYERDPYAGFLVSPEESLAEPLREELRNSGAFRAVTEPDSQLKPDVELEISVPQLYGDFRDKARPVAVLQMRFLATKNTGGKPKVLLQKDYVRKIPLSARTAAALMAGWNQALQQITTDAANDLKAAVK
ncbi:MAG TPA: ABC-type transport auxiliary lipoprotein family protein [Candidatus Angelobacter sp.]|nr:ABC-type transport auxiliary lipoprotein family protein [Candidatus Angelobacter sp.]